MLERSAIGLLAILTRHSMSGLEFGEELSGGTHPSVDGILQTLPDAFTRVLPSGQVEQMLMSLSCGGEVSIRIEHNTTLPPDHPQQPPGRKCHDAKEESEAEHDHRKLSPGGERDHARGVQLHPNMNTGRLAGLVIDDDGVIAGARNVLRQG